jgi:hypothetical protein
MMLSSEIEEPLIFGSQPGSHGLELLALRRSFRDAGEVALDIAPHRQDDLSFALKWHGSLEAVTHPHYQRGYREMAMLLEPAPCVRATSPPDPGRLDSYHATAVPVDVKAEQLVADGHQHPLVFRALPQPIPGLGASPRHAASVCDAPRP